MSEAILLGGREYISASRAAGKSGYSSDYIGQLCRAKKIPGKLIGKTWYVEFPALLEHKRDRQLKKNDNSKGRIDFLSAKIFSTEILPNLNVSVPEDNMPTHFLPPLVKKIPQTKLFFTRSFLSESVALSLVLLASMTFGLFTLDMTDPALEEKVGNEIEANLSLSVSSFIHLYITENQ